MFMDPLADFDESDEEEDIEEDEQSDSPDDATAIEEKPSKKRKRKVFDITDLHGYSSPAFQMSASKSEQEEDAKLIQNKVKEVEIEAERISSIRRAAAHAGRYDRFQRRLREAWETIDNPSYVDPLTGKKGKTSSSSSKRPGLGSQIQTSQEITPVSSPPPPPGPEQHDSAALVAAESSSNSSSLLKFGKNTGLDYSSDASKRAGLDFLSPSTANTGLPISAPAPTQPKQVDAAAPEADHPKERKKMTHAQWLGREYEKKQAREAMGVKGSGPSNKKTRSDLTQTGGEGNAHILALMKGPKQTDRGKRDDKLRQVEMALGMSTRKKKGQPKDFVGDMLWHDLKNSGAGQP